MADQLILSGVTGIIPTLLGLVGLNKNADNVKHAHQRLNQLEILLRTYPTPTTHHETYSQLLEDVHRIQGYVRKKNRPLHKMFSKPEVHFEQIWIEIEVISTKILEIRREDSALNGMPFSM
ncbi:hypothetical protein FBU30_001470 [Linnemannia zychae]|nr:hypothetical protein FBU30_001470 [Linnemannia zychae]